MKRMSIRLISVALLLVLLAGTVVPGFAVEIKSFSDVPESYWGYKTIMDMTRKGLFQGTSEIKNGVGTFMPEKVMTRAEFVTASMRAIYPEESKNIETVGSQWWKGFYELALEKNILKK